jgi:hypothetical protein
MLLVCVDAFSKFVWLFPVREATTAITIAALRHGIFACFSVPEIIVSDNAKCFVSGEFRKFCFSLGIQHITTTPYYPNPSHAERFNRNLRAALTAYHAGSQTRWDEGLPWLQVAFNMATHEATGKTPFEVIFPFPANTPLTNRWKIQDLFRPSVLLETLGAAGNRYVSNYVAVELVPNGSITGIVSHVLSRSVTLCSYVPIRSVGRTLASRPNFLRAGGDLFVLRVY